MNLHEILDHLSDSTKNVLDLAAIGVVVGTIANMLPTIAAALSIVWTLVRLWESETGQRLRRRLFKRKGADADATDRA